MLQLKFNVVNIVIKDNKSFSMSVCRKLSCPHFVLVFKVDDGSFNGIAMVVFDLDVKETLFEKKWGGKKSWVFFSMDITS